MNTYVARTICVEMKDSIQRFCKCPQTCCSKFCASSGTAVLIPAAFWLQLTALFYDRWAYKDTDLPQSCTFYNGTLNCSSIYFGCLSKGYSQYQYAESTCLCTIEITSVAIMGLLMIVGFGVCCQACCRNITVESCKVCYVCILSLLSLIPGILDLCCCLITVKVVSDHREEELIFGFSFYVYTIIGGVTLLISLASVCGYIFVKTCELREDYEFQIGSDEDDREDASLLNTN